MLDHDGSHSVHDPVLVEEAAEASLKKKDGHLQAPGEYSNRIGPWSPVSFTIPRKNALAAFVISISVISITASLFVGCGLGPIRFRRSWLSFQRPHSG
jgi:hypothetical protein